MKIFYLLTLFVCLNGQLLSTEKPILYGWQTKTVSIERAVSLGIPCLNNTIHESGFESGEDVTEFLCQK